MNRTKILTVFALIAVVLLAGCLQAPTTTQGRAVFTIKDAAADMGTVSSIKVTIDSVQVHNATEGWVTVSSTPQTYDLLKLKTEGSQALLADVSLKTGTYQQVRLMNSKVVVTDASGDHEAKLPSGDLKIVGELTVNTSSTSTATFDFIADESLHVTGNGEYIFAPVVKLETRENADVDVSSKANVKINRGTIKTNIKVGMDIDGNIGVGINISKDTKLSIEGEKIKTGGLGRAVFIIKDAAADMGTVSSVKVTIDSVQVHSAAEGWVNVSSTPQTYDLLKLKTEGSQALLADVSLKTGTYQQVRLMTSKVVVTDTSGDHEAKLPSGDLKIVGELTVNASSTSTATFDFIANESLHVTGNGEYIFAPVVKLETRENADVDVSSKENVKINRGTIKTNIKVGMDIDGNSGVGLNISKETKLSIGGGKIKIGGTS
ncbi:MAG: DUF4382 domain-containing protein [Candidatus Methanoperedens sp.]